MPSIETSGATISYQREGSGPPVLLIQGVGAVGEAWRPQIDGLARSFTLIAPDNRGIGRSIISDGRALTIEDMARDCLAVMDAEGIERFHVTGHSMGGVIAQAIALIAPSRVTSLAFLCTFARGKDGARMTLPIVITALRMRIGTRAMRRNAFLGLIMPARYLQSIDRAALAETLHPLFGHDLADQPPIAMSQLRAMSHYNVTERLQALSHIPTLVVSATEDRIAVPSTGKALAAAIPGARYVELADSGHGVTIHRAGRINELLSEHYSTSSLRPPAIPATRL